MVNLMIEHNKNAPQCVTNSPDHVLTRPMNIEVSKMKTHMEKATLHSTGQQDKGRSTRQENAGN